LQSLSLEQSTVLASANVIIVMMIVIVAISGSITVTAVDLVEFLMVVEIVAAKLMNE